eukprot:1262148-Rhodomonas_salina.1
MRERGRWRGHWRAALARCSLTLRSISESIKWVLASGLGQCKALAETRFSSMGIGAEGAGRLAGVLEKSTPALACLVLWDKAIGDEGAEALARAQGEHRVWAPWLE